jgi:hypothetical protein
MEADTRRQARSRHRENLLLTTFCGSWCSLAARLGASVATVVLLLATQLVLAGPVLAVATGEAAPASAVTAVSTYAAAP